MQNRMRDYLDDRSHAQAKKLEQAFQRLEDNVQVQKNENTIKDDLKKIESLCSSLDDTVMSHGHCGEIEDWAQKSSSKL